MSRGDCAMMICYQGRNWEREDGDMAAVGRRGKGIKEWKGQ